MVKRFGVLIPFLCGFTLLAQIPPEHDLRFSHLPKIWDEAIPLGNGMVGVLVWEKDERLRLSLDRADLWDLRASRNMDLPEFRFSWILGQVRRGEYSPVQKLFDEPYDQDAAPTKIPAGALEFEAKVLGAVTSVHLDLQRATCEVRWSSGATLTTFVHATRPLGWFRFRNVPPDFAPRLRPPAYVTDTIAATGQNPTVDGQDLRRLGYTPPQVASTRGEITYHQRGYGDFSYDIYAHWRRPQQGELEGVWSISTNASYDRSTIVAKQVCSQARRRGYTSDRKSHLTWWQRYWHQSEVTLPDTVLERQWYLEQYKFGSVARRGAPPITLQAVWTADNGKLPPWRGDIHNDLNTELSYWPGYAANHIEESASFVDWLWRIRPVAFSYTRRFFGTGGLNVPGVATLTGEPMGGWVQYALSPTVSAWLAHHFYLHWRYSKDRGFLRDRAYPWIRDVARHLEQLSIRDEAGRRQLPLSSSPEIGDNRIDAWFVRTTNYDLALIKWLFHAASELAGELGDSADALQWKKVYAEWPEFAVADNDGKLLVAPGVPLKESHRHFSHLMAIHPLGVLDWDQGERSRSIIRASLADLDTLRTDWWCGYSFAWLGSLQARARNGDAAARALRAFAECFCLPNSFHANGDQSRTGKSRFTYRPVTLEGNFAFAQGIQEMLLQSHGSAVHLFPATPAAWRNVAFRTLRAEGAFLVSAARKEGKVVEVRVVSEKGGTFRCVNPFGSGRWRTESTKQVDVTLHGDVLGVTMRPGEVIVFRAFP
jgi:alpha-L-fucosidase 2